MGSKVIEQYNKGRHVYDKFTICEMHRQMYDIVMLTEDFENKERLIELLEKAFLMGIKLVDKLAEYKLQYRFLSPSEKMTDTKEAERIRQLRINLQKEKDRAVGNRLRPE